MQGGAVSDKLAAEMYRRATHGAGRIVLLQSGSDQDNADIRSRKLHVVNHERDVFETDLFVGVNQHILKLASLRDLANQRANLLARNIIFR